MSLESNHFKINLSKLDALGLLSAFVASGALYGRSKCGFVKLKLNLPAFKRDLSVSINLTAHGWLLGHFVVLSCKIKIGWPRNFFLVIASFLHTCHLISF
jgi:hypothetical protein